MLYLLPDTNFISDTYLLQETMTNNTYKMKHLTWSSWFQRVQIHDDGAIVFQYEKMRQHIW